MRSTELDATLGVWSAASRARGRPGDGPRLALARSMLQRPASTTFVAVTSQVIGMALIEPRRDGQPSGIGDEVWVQISMLFVHPSAQRKGVGTALLRRVFAVARAWRSAGVRVWTGTDNGPAQRLYAGLAMVPTGRRTPGTFSEQMEYERVVIRS